MSERGRSSLYIIVTRIINSFKIRNANKNVKFIDTDNIGNSYYEIEADPSRGKRVPKRWYQPKIAEDWDKPLPPEWDSWLRNRRSEPPSKDELEYNLAIQLRKKQYDEKHKKPDDENLIKKHSFSDFPKYPDISESPGFGDENRDRKK